ENRGLGLLTGSADCSATPWLFLGQPGAASKKKLFQFLHDGKLSLFVQGRSVLASRKPFEGAIVLESSGGPLTVPVRFHIPIIPFSGGVFDGCTSPRQVADKAVGQPREAGELLASGAVARWYAANGWSYPVKEPAASGVAAVQQFFEALGLSKPPRVVLDRSALALEGRPGEAASAAVELSTDEKRPVWAAVDCAAPWLDVREVVLDKKGATVRLGASRVPDSPGETLTAKATITTNGRQRHAVSVTLAVKGKKREAVAPPPVPPPIPRPRPAPGADAPGSPPVERQTPGTKAWLPVLLILLGLTVTLGRDVGAWWAGKGGPGPDMARFTGRDQVVWLGFHDYEKRVKLAAGGSVKPGEAAGGPKIEAVWEPSMRFGLFMAQKEGKDRYRRLTFEEEGTTNNCVVRLDGQELLFGERPFRQKATGEPIGGAWAGQWQEREAKLDRPLKDGRKSVWLYEAQKVTVTQTVGLVVGEQSGRIDTCLVHYRIDNKDAKPHRVGLRFLLDTFIGANDGVPFLIPGQTKLCSTTAEFPRPDLVPDFIQACEREDLADPGTVAQVQFRLAGLEPPSRVTLGAWPNPKLGGNARQEKTMWDVPVLPIKTLPPGDSAVAMYWEEKEIAAGGSREMGFSYGLGSVSAGGTSGRLALTAGGSFQPGGEFTLTAYVSSPAAGQTVTVELPEGFELVAGEKTAKVPLPDAGTRLSPVTWRVKAGSAGRYSLKVSSSTGHKQAHAVEIKVRGLFGN
ncbi:MAG: hypothetical protein K2W96_13840, partial [Gemmataceae bacterium]|nr:hypothetical protein [Gemmataceae bacterium]